MTPYRDLCLTWSALAWQGVVYGVTPVPCATTLCVINLRSDEARVEAITTEYLQLHVDPTANAAVGDGYPQTMAGADDDDDVYQVLLCCMPVMQTTCLSLLLQAYIPRHIRARGTWSLY